MLRVERAVVASFVFLLAAVALKLRIAFVAACAGAKSKRGSKESEALGELHVDDVTSSVGGGVFLSIMFVFGCSCTRR